MERTKVMSTTGGADVLGAISLEQEISGKIHTVKGHRVMLDADLAELYGVETKHLKRQVQRNIDRFPSDFMLVLTARELAGLRYQIGTSNTLIDSERGGSRVLPFAFTEQGIAMLSSVLNSERAIQVNIRIIRIFTRMRELLMAHKDILHKLEQMEQRISLHDEDIGTLFDNIRQLLTPEEGPRSDRQRIGYRKDQL
jgi:phage regulator Rha-like protein